MLHRRLVGLILAALFLGGGEALAESSSTSSTSSSLSTSAASSTRQVAEADLLLFFGQHLGRAPFVAPGAWQEFGVARWLGLAVGGHAVIVTPRTLGFLSETGVGGGADLAARFYIRGAWPRGFGVGAAMSLVVIDGMAVVMPRAELYYRFIIFSRLSVRLNGVFGGLILWDAVPNRTEPLIDEETDLDGRITGLLIGVGLSIGFAGTGPPWPAR